MPLPIFCLADEILAGIRNACYTFAPSLVSRVGMGSDFTERASHEVCSLQTEKLLFFSAFSVSRPMSWNGLPVALHPIPVGHSALLSR